MIRFKILKNARNVVVLNLPRAPLALAFSWMAVVVVRSAHVNLDKIALLHVFVMFIKVFTAMQRLELAEVKLIYFAAYVSKYSY